MKLITEQSFDTKFLIEDTNDKKEYFLEGVFMQAEIKNRNGRVYEKNVLEQAVNRYVETQVKTNRSVGELNHPSSASVNYKEVSHKIESLEWRGNDVVGRAKILNTPNGQLVKSLLDGGVQIGVSSRGMGSVDHREGTDYIGSDFVLNTIDIVQDPSAPAAYVNGIMEGVEWERSGDIFIPVNEDTAKSDFTLTFQVTNKNDKETVTVTVSAKSQKEAETLGSTKAIQKSGIKNGKAKLVKKKQDESFTPENSKFLALRQFINNI